MIEELDGSDDLLRLFAYADGWDNPVMMEAPDVADVDGDQDTTEIKRFKSSSLFLGHTQLIGSITQVTDEDEVVVESYEYDAYGNTTIYDINSSVVAASQIENPYMYTARRMDEETGLYHYRARAYSPTLRRFIQRDPLEYVDGPNAFAYVRGRVTCASDPSGLAEGDSEQPDDCCDAADCKACCKAKQDEEMGEIQDNAGRRWMKAFSKRGTIGSVVDIVDETKVPDVVKGLSVETLKLGAAAAAGKMKASQPADAVAGVAADVAKDGVEALGVLTPLILHAALRIGNLTADEVRYANTLYNDCVQACDEKCPSKSARGAGSTGESGPGGPPEISLFDAALRGASLILDCYLLPEPAPPSMGLRGVSGGVLNRHGQR